MFIQCSDCHYKYLVNSADLKPKGRMVQCANCNHKWFQEPLNEEDLLSASFPETSFEKKDNIKNNLKDPSLKQIKNLPSTIVNEPKVSMLNSFIMFMVLFIFLVCFWLFRSYGTSILVLAKFYINEFYFNLKLIISDIAKIIHHLLN